MKIWIENYNEARRFKPSVPTIAVRVFDPGARPYKTAARWEDYPDDCWDNCPEAPWNTDAYLAVFGYTFSDVNMDAAYPESVKESLNADPSVVFFTSDMAADLVERFSKVYQNAEGLLVHCNAGASRSVAIALALADSFPINAEFQGRAKLYQDKRDYLGCGMAYRLTCEAAAKR